MPSRYPVLLNFHEPKIVQKLDHIAHGPCLWEIGSCTPYRHTWQSWHIPDYASGSFLLHFKFKFCLLTLFCFFSHGLYLSQSAASIIELTQAFFRPILFQSVSFLHSRSNYSDRYFWITKKIFVDFWSVNPSSLRMP